MMNKVEKFPPTRNSLVRFHWEENVPNEMMSVELNVFSEVPHCIFWAVVLTDTSIQDSALYEGFMCDIKHHNYVKLVKLPVEKLGGVVAEIAGTVAEIAGTAAEFAGAAAEIAGAELFEGTIETVIVASSYSTPAEFGC
jgi:hypothetical protein